MTIRETLFQLDTTISGMLHLEPLDPDSPCALDLLSDLVGHLLKGEFTALFHIEWSDDERTRFRHLLAFRRGWIVTGMVMAPESVKRSADGMAVTYDARESGYVTVLVYGNTLEAALGDLTEQAAKIRMRALSAATSRNSNTGARPARKFSSSAARRGQSRRLRHRATRAEGREPRRSREMSDNPN